MSPPQTTTTGDDDDVENPGISYSDILILIPDSRAVFDLIFTLFILFTLSRYVSYLLSFGLDL